MREKELIEQFFRNHTMESFHGREKLNALVQNIARIPWGEGRTIEEVLRTKRVGTCTGKHLVLQECLEQLGIPHRIVVCTFRWSEQGIDLPEHLRAILAEGEWVHGHNFLQIQNNHGQWIDLDITWDPPLKPYGFRTLLTDWDGKTSFIGLDPLIERRDNASLEKKQEWLQTLTPEAQERRERFLGELFLWVTSLRGASPSSALPRSTSENTRYL